MEKNYEALNLLQPESEHDPFTENRYRQFHKFLPQDARSVLDIGCDTGRGGNALKGLDSNRQIYGRDAVCNWQDRLPNNVYEEGVHGYSTKIPHGDGTYDAVVVGEFIEHIYRADIDQTLGEIFRVLKIGDGLLLTTPNPSGIKRKTREQSILDRAHLSQHFPDALKLKLRMAGFSRVSVYSSARSHAMSAAASPCSSMAAIWP